MSRLWRVLTVVLAVFSVPAAEAQQRVWTETGQAVEGWEYVDDGIRDFMQTWAVPGAALALAADGRLLFARGYTWDTADAEIVQPSSLFRIASMSKPITSVAVHQLIERGLLSYDTRLVDVLDLQPLPGHTRDPWLDDVTIDHLLYHTGGWDRDISFDPMFADSIVAATLGVDLPISKRDIVTYMTGLPMQFEPGSRFAYSNYGYCLLGLVIEEITGRDYSEWVAENVFQPIGVGRPRRGHTVLHERAPGEVRYYGVAGDDPYRWNIENMDAHGGWILSAPDYARLLSALFDDFDASPLLSRQSLENMVRTNPATSTAYGRGWTVEQNGSAMIYGHGGSLPGTLTTAQWSEPGVAMVGLINTRKDMADLEIDTPTQMPEHDLFASVGISAQAIGAALAESWVPVVAASDGAGGSVWRSDVGLLNRSTLSNEVLLRVEMAGLAVDHELEIAPGQQVVVADLVNELGLSGTGSLRVFSSEPLTVASRIYNLSSDGTFGQSLGGVTGPGGLRSGGSAVLMQLREDESARSNIGVLNAGRRAARVEIALFDATGQELARFVRAVDPRRTRQFNQVFEVQGGRTDVTVGYAVVTVLEGEEVVVYGSVVDNGTNDPTTIPMAMGAGNTISHVSAAARIEGAAGSVWRTDLGVLNTGSEPVEVVVEFNLGDGLFPTLGLDLQPGEHRLLEDVIGLVRTEGSGSLKITSNAPVLTSSRTYNRSSDGSFGQFLGGAGPETAIGEGDKVWLPLLQQNDDFRTNIGLHNISDAEVRAKIFLHEGGGGLLATAQRTLNAGGRVQIQEPFDRLTGRNDIDSGYAVVEVLAGDGLIAYASVVDNRTNDPTTIAMVR